MVPEQVWDWHFLFIPVCVFCLFSVFPCLVLIWFFLWLPEEELSLLYLLHRENGDSSILMKDICELDQNTKEFVKKKILWDVFLAGLPSEEVMDDMTHIESVTWKAVVKDYWTLLTPLIFSDNPKRPGDDDPLPPSNLVRNVMDMNAGYGDFNAALLLAGKPVWVMNVIPTTVANTLPIVYDRGLVGIMHDWLVPHSSFCCCIIKISIFLHSRIEIAS